MSLFTAIRQRIADHRRERRIRALRVEACELLAIDKERARAVAKRMFDECAQRSPQQVRRMEEEQGLRGRVAIKSALVAGYCNGYLPRRCVDAAFRLLRLRSL